MAPYILYSRLFGLRHYSKYSIEKKREKKKRISHFIRVLEFSFRSKGENLFILEHKHTTSKSHCSFLTSIIY